MTNNAIAIHAEVLANVRQLSIIVSLPSPANSSSLVQISFDGSLFNVTHDNATQSLELPAAVVPPKEPFPLPQGAAEPMIRLPLASGPKSGVFRIEDQDVPWTAVDLVVGSEITCRGCDQVLVADGVVTEWKNLPSENWAEMMDFWHCHKPVANHAGDQDGDDNATTKAYGANSAISSQPGIGFTDLISFMFHDGDCQNLQYELPCSDDELDLSPSQHVRPKTNPVFCSACKCEIGYVGGPPGSVNLFKWQTKCSTHGPWAPPHVTELLSTALLAIVSRFGASKSLVMSRYPGGDQDPDTVLHIWILNNNIVHSSTIRRERVTSIKVGFTVITRETADNLLESVSSDFQEVNLPQDAIQECLKALNEAHQNLNHSAREFRGFHVSLLKRWMGQG